MLTVEHKPEGRDLARRLRCQFIETSAKERINVNEAFYNLVREIRRHNRVSRWDVNTYDNHEFNANSEIGAAKWTSNGEYFQQCRRPWATGRILLWLPGMYRCMSCGISAVSICPSMVIASSRSIAEMTTYDHKCIYFRVSWSSCIRVV